jgi:hypothetical protein
LRETAQTTAAGEGWPAAATDGMWMTFRWHFLLTALASVLLSAWCSYALPIPNPDAVLYLRAADQFSVGQWSEGFDTYKWPFYSLLIAGMKVVTGLETLIAAQVVNALLSLGLTLALIALAVELTNGDRAVVTVACILVLMQSQLMGMRPAIVKEHGYLAFMVATVLFAVVDNDRPSWRTKLALVSSLAGATLFRIEGLYLALLVVGFYVLVRLKTVTAQVTTIVLFVLTASALLPFAFRLWVGGSLEKLMSGSAVFDVSIFWSIILKRVHLLETEILTFGAGIGWHIYASVAIGIAFYQTLRAVTPVYAFYGLFSFIPNRLVPRKAMLPLIWFAAGQAPLLFLFAFLNAMLELRYALGFAVIAIFTTIFCATASWRELRMLRPRAFVVFPSLIATVLIAWAIELPHPGQLHPFRKASEWVKQNVPQGARIWTNEARIAYFADLPYGQTGGITGIVALPPTEFEKSGEVDVVILSGDGGAIAPPRPVEDLTLRARFVSETDVVLIYAACPAMNLCPPPAS